MDQLLSHIPYPISTHDLVQLAKQHGANDQIKVDPFVKTGGRAVLRATLLLFLSVYFSFYGKTIGVPVEYTSAGV